jgi:acyl-CoA thioesterase-2
VTAEAERIAGGGQAVVDGLVRLLDLEPIEQNIFRGVSPNVSLQRVFGGQVAGQALVAATRTVEADRSVHSLHSYFIRPGDPAVPIVYLVERVRDGRSFSVRRVLAIQHGQPIFTLSASFQLGQGGIDHQQQMPEVPRPDELPTLAERLEGFEELRAMFSRIPQAFDIRYVDDPPWVQRALGPREHQPHRIWMKADGVLPDDPTLHVCVVTFASRPGSTRSTRPRWITRCGFTGSSGPTSGSSTSPARRRPPEAGAWPPDGSSPGTAGWWSAWRRRA